jgi:hypothetical protein
MLGTNHSLSWLRGLRAISIIVMPCIRSQEIVVANGKRKDKGSVGKEGPLIPGSIASQ